VVDVVRNFVVADVLAVGRQIFPVVVEVLADKAVVGDKIEEMTAADRIQEHKQEELMEAGNRIEEDNFVEVREDKGRIEQDNFVTGAGHIIEEVGLVPQVACDFSDNGNCAEARMVLPLSERLLNHLAPLTLVSHPLYMPRRGFVVPYSRVNNLSGIAIFQAKNKLF
jgi:hypothetical protein